MRILKNGLLDNSISYIFVLGLLLSGKREILVCMVLKRGGMVFDRIESFYEKKRRKSRSAQPALGAGKQEKIQVQKRERERERERGRKRVQAERFIKTARMQKR